MHLAKEGLVHQKIYPNRNNVMKNNTQFLKLAFLSVASLFVAANSYAIPASYGTASHHTTYWQELSKWDGTGTKIDDKGVYWSTDGGATWGREDLTVGETVQFQFNLHKEHVGTHYADHVKAWVDWDQDGSFDNTDVVFYGEQFLPTGSTYNPNSSLIGTHLHSGENYVFTSGSFLLEASHIGSLWLRTRVTCSESLTHGIRSSWSAQWQEPHISSYESYFNPTGHLHQGEVEEWKITVNPVPDAVSTLALLGSALVGLTAIRRRIAR